MGNRRNRPNHTVLIPEPGTDLRQESRLPGATYACDADHAAIGMLDQPGDARFLAVIVHVSGRVGINRERGSGSRVC